MRINNAGAINKNTSEKRKLGNNKMDETFFLSFLSPFSFFKTNDVYFKISDENKNDWYNV